MADHLQGFRHTQAAFTAHIRAPDAHPAPADIAPERMALYRELFFNNIESFLKSGFPLVHKLLEGPAWLELVQDFFARHRCRTPYFWGIPEEFLRYLHDERGERPADPPFLLELAHYEWVELALSIAEDEAPCESPALLTDPIEAVITLSPLAWPLAYRYPVHRIGPDFQPQDTPAEPTCLAVYRDRADEVRFLELNPVTYRLLRSLEQEGPLPARHCLTHLAAELSYADLDAFMAHGAELLRDLTRRGVIGAG